MQRKQAIIAGLLAGTAAMGLVAWSQRPATVGGQTVASQAATGQTGTVVAPAGDIETLLARLGESEEEVARLREALAERDARIAELTAALDERDSLIATLQAEAAELATGDLPVLIAERDARIEELTAALAARNADIGRVRSEMEALLASADLALSERGSRIDALNATIAERDAAIAALQAEAEALRTGGESDLAGALAERDTRIDRLATTLAGREAEIDALLGQIDSLRSGSVALAERDARISELTAAVAEREVAGGALRGELGALQAGADPARAEALRDEAAERRIRELTAELEAREAQVARLESEVAELRGGAGLAPTLIAGDAADKPVLAFRDETTTETLRVEAMLDALKLGPDAAVPVTTPVALRVAAPSPGDAGALAEVHFEIGSARLSPGAQARAAAAVVVLADMPVTRIRLVGFADRTGNPGFNRRLAEERAAAVAAFLVANGLSAEVIETAGVIEAAYLPVETGPGVSEPLNRSVAIIALAPPTS